MRKKQLLTQSTYLFAEIERKSGEIEGLKLKIEEIEQKVKYLSEENEKLQALLAEERINYKELEEINNQLRSEILVNISAQAVMSTQEKEEQQIPQAFETSEEICFAPEITEESKEPELPIIEIKPQINESEEIEKPEPQINSHSAETVTKSFTPVDDALRDYGATVIGKVTRITAGVISKITQNGGDAAGSLQTLALGKNESFKYQILSIAQNGKAPEEIKAEMNALADEAIAYLESIL